MKKVNEKKLIAKRKYTENHPEIKMSTYAPIRNRILNFIDESGHVTKSKLKEFFATIKEEISSNTSMATWVRRNRRLLTERTINGEKTYKLSNHGRRVKNKLEKYEQLKEVNESSNIDIKSKIIQEMYNKKKEDSVKN